MPMMTSQSPSIAIEGLTATVQVEGQQKPLRRIACERCRAAKVKCFKDNDNEENKCRRCNDAGIDCSFAPIVTRRRRKRTDARVTALEEELRKIKSSLQSAGDSKQSSSGSHRRGAATKSPASHSTLSDDHRSSTPSQRSNSDFEILKSPASPSCTRQAPLDILSSLLSKDDAIKLLVDFMEDILPQYPVVAFSEFDTYDSLEMEKPLVLLASITAACGARNQAIFQQLHSRLVETLADRVFMRGEASLELNQAIMIMEVWFSAPEDFQRGSFYQWIHTSATMTLQLGLGQDRSGEEWQEASRRPSSEACSGHEEELRTLLSSYLLCSSISVSMRKDNFLGLTSAVRQALHHFTSCGSSVNDRRLVAWIRLQLIAEEAQMLMSNLSCASSEPHCQDSALKPEISRLQNQYEEWRRSLDAEIMTESLMIHFQYCKARLLEIPLHLKYDFDALVPPFISKSTSRNGHARRVQKFQIRENTNEIQNFVNALHILTRTFLAMLPEVLAQCPNVTFVRALYAIKALLMLEETLRTVPGAETISASQLRVRYFLERVRSHIVDAYRMHKGTATPLSLRLLDQISDLYPAAGTKISDGEEISHFNNNTTDLAIPVDDTMFWNQLPEVQSDSNAVITSSNIRSENLMYTLPIDDTGQWLPSPMELGREFWDMEYFPLNV